MLETLLNIDGGLLLLIQEYARTPLLDKIMVFITSLGNGGMIWIAATILLLIPKKGNLHATVPLPFCTMI